VDGDRKPIVGAHVCYLTAGAEILCLQTDSKGHYDLPTSKQESIRIRMQGYQPRTLAAVDHEEPIVLEKAATLLVVLEDAETGERIPEGEILVIHSSGRERGPFPSRTAGVRVRSLPPGPVTLIARAMGYGEKVFRLLVLEAGRETGVTVSLSPLAQGQPEATATEN
jgi:hypothetical protein